MRLLLHEHAVLSVHLMFDHARHYVRNKLAHIARSYCNLLQDTFCKRDNLLINPRSCAIQGSA